MAVLGKQSLKNLSGVHPDLVRVMKEAIKDTPIDFTITDGGRTVEMQKALYRKGRDANGKVINKGLVVTNADGVKNRSNHQAHEDGFFHAVDLYPYVDRKIDFDDVHGFLPAIAKHILSVAKRLGIQITWGGNFKATATKPKGWDKPHFELTK